MKFLRLLACIILVLPLTSAEAWIHGSESIVTNNQRVTVNFNPGGNLYLNISKGWGITFRPDNCSGGSNCTDSNGFPTSSPTSPVSANVSHIAGFYGTYTMAWGGSSASEFTADPPTIYTTIAPQGAVFEMGNVSSGDIGPGNHTIEGQINGSVTTLTNLIYQYGWNIQSIQNDGSGHIQINTKTNFAGSCTSFTITQGYDQNGNFGKLVNISGANSNTGANGAWAIASCSASSFVLTGSTFSNAQAGVGGTGIIAASNQSFKFLANTGYSGFNSFTVARTIDLPALAANHYPDATLVSQFSALMNPNGNCAANHDCGYARFMDFQRRSVQFRKRLFSAHSGRSDILRTIFLDTERILGWLDRKRRIGQLHSIESIGITI